VESNLVTLQIPSIPGYEKTAMITAAELARLAGADEEKALNLSTAVSEACLNAMEHSHRFNTDMPIKLTFRCRPGLLSIDIEDSGKPFEIPSSRPSLDIEKGAKCRGWGLFLIHNLVDKFEVLPTECGNAVRITILFPGD